jgi:hypothetical protein
MYVYKYVAVQPRTYSDLLGSQNTTNTTNITNIVALKVPLWGSIGLRPLSFTPTQKKLSTYFCAVQHFSRGKRHLRDHRCVNNDAVT